MFQDLESTLEDCGRIVLEGSGWEYLPNFVDMTAMQVAMQVETPVFVSWNGVEVEIDPNKTVDEIMDNFYEKHDKALEEAT